MQFWYSLLEEAREEIWNYLDNLLKDRQTDGWTNGQTELVSKLLLQLKRTLKTQMLNTDTFLSWVQSSEAGKHKRLNP